MDLTNWAQYKTMIAAGVGSALVTLFAGKTIRRILLLPFKLAVARSKNKEELLILKEAAKDLGLPEDAAVLTEDKTDAPK